MLITRVSVFSGMETTMDLPVTDAELQRIAAGELIQNVLPHLTADEREFLLTGAAPGEWDSMFSGSEYEEDGEAE